MSVSRVFAWSLLTCAAYAAFNPLAARADEPGPGMIVVTIPAPPDGWKPIEKNLGFPTASPDFRHVAFTAEKVKDDNNRAVIDGLCGPEFFIINFIRFSPSSDNFHYVGSEQGGKEYLVTSGKQTLHPGLKFKDRAQFSPDGRHFMYTLLGDTRNGFDPQTGKKWTLFPASLVLDGNRETTYGFLGGAAFSPNSLRYAHIAILAGRPVMVVDGKVYGTHEMFPNLIFGPTPLFSPDSKRIAYVASTQTGLEFAMVDGKSESKHSRVTGLVFSPDSKKLAYLVRDEGQYQVYLDGQAAGDRFTLVFASIQFSPDSRRLGYAATGINGGLVVIDGQTVPAGDKVYTGPVFSPNSQGYACGAIKNKKAFVIRDGKTLPGEYDGFATDLVYSPDSTHLAFVAKKGDKFVVVVDATVTDTHDWVEYSGFGFSPDSKHLAYWARDGKGWRLVVDGIPSPVEFHQPLKAEHQVIDLEHYSLEPGLRFEPDGSIRAAALIDAAGEAALIELRPGTGWEKNMTRMKKQPAVAAAALVTAPEQKVIADPPDSTKKPSDK